MAFELAEIDPTSVPINLLNPRPGTKFGDRDYMDPWEAVKWIAIFRLILPDALFRLCGGRVENLGELQPLAVKAGLNGVMMGNFLTTLGNTPERGPRDVRGARAQRRAASPTTGPTRGPTTAPAGWRARRPTSSRSYLDTPPTPRGRIEVRLWDPSTQLRLRQEGRSRRARRRAQPLATAATTLERQQAATRDGPTSRSGWTSSRRLGLHRRMRLVSGPQGPRVVLDGQPVLLLCSNNYLGLADHPRVREAAADAAMRWGVGRRRSRLVSGQR